MSRSLKHFPCIKDNGKHKRWGKNQANRKVRRSELDSANGYKKLYEQWNICDWRWIDFSDQKFYRK